MSDVALIIGPRYELSESYSKYGARTVISVFEACEKGNCKEPTPDGVEKINHHKFYFDDVYIGNNFDWKEAPTEQDIRNILDLYPKYLPKKEDSPVYVHCFAGVSRSAAIAYAIYCKALGEGKEIEAMKLTNASAPYKGIWPSDYITNIADSILERKGKMIEVLAQWKAEVQANKNLAWT